MSDFFESLGKESLHTAEDDTTGFGPHTGLKYSEYMVYFVSYYFGMTQAVITL